MVPYTTAQTVGITMLVVGGLGLVTTFVWMFVNSTDRRESTLNAKYILALALSIFAAPSAYEFPHSAGLGPWHGLIALGAILVQWILIFFWIGFTFVDSETGWFRAGNWIVRGGEEKELMKQSLKSHHIDRFYSPRQALYFILFGWMSQTIVYLVGWGVDTEFKSMEPTAIEPVVAAIAVTSFVLSIMFVLLYYFGQDKDWWPNASRRNEVEDYDTHVKGKIQKQV
jgi:hypothetical protein